MKLSAIKPNLDNPRKIEKHRCYGIEIDEKYCQIIVDRMLKLDPNLHIETR